MRFFFCLRNNSVFCNTSKNICLLFQRAREEAAQKKDKVKLLTDSVSNFIATVPPNAHEPLKKELTVLVKNYERLCSRLNGKCETLEVSYLATMQLFWGSTLFSLQAI